MVSLKIKKGLDIPLKGIPSGKLRSLEVKGKPISIERVCLDLSKFDEKKFKLLVKPGDIVKKGDPLAQDKGCPERLFVAPGGGVIEEFQRGIKRRLLSIPILLAKEEESKKFSPINPSIASREEIVTRLCEGGMFPFIRQRPFDLLADPRKTPRAIFVNGANTSPFAPPFELEIQGNHQFLEVGLETLKKLSGGEVHLVVKKGDESTCSVKGVTTHTVEGPHPAGLVSTHIHLISPIRRLHEVVWTLSIADTIAIGYLMSQGEFMRERVISIGGEGVSEEGRGFFKGRLGLAVNPLVQNRLDREEVRLIAGDVLTGTQVSKDDFLGFYDQILSVVPERSQTQEPLHFFRLGMDKFSASRTYLSGFLKRKLFSFDTNQHGEERFFVTGDPYTKVVPLSLNPMLLVKSVLAEDTELSEKLGILEVAPEDFALPSFVCPCKIEMIDIIRRGLRRHASETTDHV